MVILNLGGKGRKISPGLSPDRLHIAVHASQGYIAIKKTREKMIKMREEEEEREEEEGRGKTIFLSAIFIPCFAGSLRLHPSSQDQLVYKDLLICFFLKVDFLVSIVYTKGSSSYLYFLLSIVYRLHGKVL